MLDLITFGLVESIIALAYGIVAICAFAGVLVRKNWVKILCLLFIMLSLQTVLFLTLGYDLTWKLYPLHTHLVIILCMKKFFGIRPYAAFVYTMLAYMGYQIPAWISRLVYLVFPGSEVAHFIFYSIGIVLTVFFIFTRVGNSANELLGRSVKADLLFGLTTFLYYLFD